jgi:hypothetical protein
MTDGNGEPSRRIRIRVTGDDAQNLAALHRWLSLEEWFARAEAEQGLSVVYREYDGAERDPAERRDGPPMSGGLAELVLVIAGAALSPVFEDLYRKAKVAARAWADNTSSDDHPVGTTVLTDDPAAADGPARVPADSPSAAAPGNGEDDDEDGRNT